MLSFLLAALVGAAASDAPSAPPCPPLPAACPDRLPASGTDEGAVAASAAREFRANRSLAWLNAVRTAAGTSALERSATLSVSASRHAAYLSDNGLRSAPSIHAEATGLPAFSGVDPFVRMRVAGYRYTYATEAVGDVGSAALDTDCIAHLMDTIYHATLLLSRVTEGGLAYGSGDAAGTCVVDLGAPLAPPATPDATPRRIVRYPWPGMSLPTGTYRLATENPRPSILLLPGPTAGMPVLAGLRRAASVDAGTGERPVELQEYTLRDAFDAVVPSVVLADAAISGPGVVADPALHGGFAVLVPRMPLLPGRYRVVLRATIGTETIDPTPWTFNVLQP
jgi:hypothetical protein